MCVYSLFIEMFEQFLSNWQIQMLQFRIVPSYFIHIFEATENCRILLDLLHPNQNKLR